MPDRVRTLYRWVEPDRKLYFCSAACRWMFHVSDPSLIPSTDAPPEGIVCDQCGNALDTPYDERAQNPLPK